MIIKFDDREPTSTEMMMKLVDDDVLMLRTRLECGDYVWEDVCIERKTIDDFCGSIMDGRIANQVDRMNDMYKENFVIVVGRIKDRTCEIHENCVLGKITSLVVKHGINVICVDDEFQFLYLMKRIFEKYEEIREGKRKELNDVVKKLEEVE